MTETGGTRQNQERRAASGRREADHDERYEKLVELALDGILIHDGEHILLANAAALRLAGADHRDQLIGRPIDAFLNPPYLKAVQVALVRSGDSAALVPTVRDAFRRLDGSEIEVEVTAIAFVDRGRPHAHLVVRDITERLAMQAAARQADEHLQQAQKMEAVGALAGGVAHEVNNMMSVILGFSEFLLGDPALSAERHSEVRHIVRAAERTAAVTRQLLAFSRRAFHRPQVLDLGAAVQELEPVVRRLLGEERHLAVASEASPRVRVDKGQFEQVIVNLALNARDAMPTGGTLTLTTAETELANVVASSDGVAIPAGRYGLVVVQDTGTGMDVATQTHVFEPFFTTKAVGKGTGLGLAAADGIMKQNGGYISLASAPGLGSTFTLYLPVLSEVDVVERRSEPRGEPLLPALDEAQAGAIILMVEDEPAVRAIVARSLERSGYRVHSASSGADALEVVRREGRPDLVLTDLMMPGLGGAELARRLRERWPDLPVLFMSGYSLEDLLRQGAIGSDHSIIQKPFTPDGLTRSVAAALVQAGKGGSW